MSYAFYYNIACPRQLVCLCLKRGGKQEKKQGKFTPPSEDVP